jgi:hypothetical protein
VSNDRTGRSGRRSAITAQPPGWSRSRRVARMEN